MLLTREEIRFDFKGAKFDLEKTADRKLLAWIFDQFLYGEVTGIQCGHWLYHAPHLNAAAFLAKQAGEEISHVKRILRIFTLLEEKPSPPHWVVKFLSTGMMGGSWGEHVALEMALGEGLVLPVFYAMAETIPHDEIKKILDSASVEEERHVEFGERETIAWLQSNPGARRHLLGQALIQVIALERFKGFILKRMARGDADHPVLSQFGAFYGHVLDGFKTRIERLGLSPVSLDEISAFGKLGLVALLPIHRLKSFLRLGKRQKLLTSTYLEDPVLRLEFERSPPA